ncbi:hypothetical protein THAOC_08817, partial [Thalassiosira oceanica]
MLAPSARAWSDIEGQTWGSTATFQGGVSSPAAAFLDELNRRQEMQWEMSMWQELTAGFLGSRHQPHFDKCERPGSTHPFWSEPRGGQVGPPRPIDRLDGPNDAVNIFRTTPTTNEPNFTTREASADVGTPSREMSSREHPQRRTLRSNFMSAFDLSFAPGTPESHSTIGMPDGPDAEELMLPTVEDGLLDGRGPPPPPSA